MGRKEFGRAKPYVSPSVRRRRRANRQMAGLLFILGIAGLASMLLVMSSGLPNIAGLVVILGIAGFGSLALGIIAATEL